MKSTAGGEVGARGGSLFALGPRLMVGTVLRHGDRGEKAGLRLRQVKVEVTVCHLG